MATRKIAQMMSAAVLGMFTLGPVLAVSTVVGLTTTPAMAQASGKDTLIFRNGKVVEGKILEETPTHVKVEIDVAGITAITTYAKSEILSMTKAEAAPESGAKPAASDKSGAKAEPTRTVEPANTAPKVYVMELEGWFGEDISETPIRQAVNDAKRHDVDYIVVVIDNDWSLKRFGQLDDIPDDVGQFDLLFRAEQMAPIFTEEIPRWSKPPKVVFWVKKAMGGAAFLPLISSNIYFSSEGKMGGIGHLNRIFGQTGHERVRQKQFSLRIAHAEGLAIVGGHDPKLISAMALDDYVMSYKMEGGRPVLLTRMPESPDEFLLTDDAKEDRQDTIEELARGEGNDCLTLNADIAYKLGVSKGTVDTLDDLLHQVGILRNHQVIKGQSENIMRGWSDGVESAKRELQRLWKDYGEVPQGGADYQERTRNRGRQKNIINNMQSLLKRYEEAINPNEIRVPDYNTLEILKRQIELEQLADRR